MKKIYLYSSAIAYVFLATPNYITAAPKEYKLNWIQMHDKLLSTQVLFDFNDTVKYERKIIPEKRQLNISFANLSFNTFNKTHAKEMLTPLVEHGLIANFQIAEVENAILVTFTFTGETQQSMVKWSKVDRSNKFIIEFYSNKKINTFKKDTILHYGLNDKIPHDERAQANKKKNHDLLIMLDAGHGGKEFGARGHGGILEKDVTLDIAKHVHALLKKRGYASALTRNDDRDLPLLKRSQQAIEAKANLFVSIHANSSGSLQAPESQGIEVFCMNGHDLLSRCPSTGFLFVNCKKDPEFIKHLDTYIKKEAAQSQNLASNIQKNLIKTLVKENFNPLNRGLKHYEYRVFLQSGMPSALIEVGFLTNPKEARLLGKSSYRKLLAHGICNGIIAHVQMC